MKALVPHADFCVSYAPGKIILVGEHAVVYGKTAIAMPIDIGVRIAFSRIDAKHPSEQGPLFRGVGALAMNEIYFKDASFGPRVLKEAVQYLFDAFGPEVADLKVVVDGALPLGHGLGSSAAFSVAMIKGMARAFSQNLSTSQLKEHALAMETIFHGRPSGIDHSVIIEGCAIGYQRMNNACEYWPISLKQNLKFIIGFSGPHDGTLKAVSALSSRVNRHPKLYGRIFDGLDDIAKESEDALRSGQLARLGELMNMAQGLLNAMSISTPQVEKICAIARAHGALGAKLTGAGGGGAVIALMDGHETQVLQALREQGIMAFVCEVPKEPKFDGGFTQ